MVACVHHRSRRPDGRGGHPERLDHRRVGSLRAPLLRPWMRRGCDCPASQATRAPATLDEALAAACEGIQGIEAGEMPAVPPLSAYAQAFAEGPRSGRIGVPEGGSGDRETHPRYLCECHWSPPGAGGSRRVHNAGLLCGEAVAVAGLRAAPAERKGYILRAVPWDRRDIRPHPAARLPGALRDPRRHKLSDDAGPPDRPHHHQPAVLPGPGVPAEIIERGTHRCVPAAAELSRVGGA